MKDAIGGSSLLYIVVFFVSIIILFFVGMMGYTKAYRVKNKIIEVIEKYETYDENVVNALTTDLQRVGYRVATSDQIKNKCGNDSLSITYGAGHLYCVYFRPGKATLGDVYEVVAYIHFNFPLIDGFLELPVRGETKVLGKDYNY